jgi:hypothetical protein
MFFVPLTHLPHSHIPDKIELQTYGKSMSISLDVVLVVMQDASPVGR